MKIKTFKLLYYIFLFIIILFFYTKDIEISKINTIDKVSTTILVNKTNRLKKDYIPKLEKLNTSYSNDNKYLTKEAKQALEQLITDSKKENLNIKVVSAYRSYKYQKELFNNYVKTYSKKYALKCCAKEGFSEHQTGLAIDIMGENKDYNLFEKTKEFKWMIKNSYKYGFILRYPKNKENITGFKYEPWHYRYVGKILAKYLYNKNITLEEYFEK